MKPGEGGGVSGPEAAWLTQRANPVLRPRLLGGGTEGNSRLTALAAVSLLVLLAVQGLSILRIHQLVSVHLFVGLMLVGPVGLKLASTGYRLARYYTHAPRYRRKGPPATPLRLLAPVLVLSTLVLFASGAILLLEGPARRGGWLGVHKLSFVIWGAAIGLHVLAHLPELLRQAPSRIRPGAGPRPVEARALRPAGAAGRWIAFGGALVAGLALAFLSLPSFAAWTQPGVFDRFGH